MTFIYLFEFSEIVIKKSEDPVTNGRIFDQQLLLLSVKMRSIENKPLVDLHCINEPELEE